MSNPYPYRPDESFNDEPPILAEAVDERRGLPCGCWIWGGGFVGLVLCCGVAAWALRDRYLEDIAPVISDLLGLDFAPPDGVRLPGIIAN